ncbi:MAG: tail fiber domain-containing protein [Bacteroidales bacterium]|jgi:hypothetical protein|nr:tail fiber domain-containing protein [Bacteroidales bacterium]
MNNLGGEPTFAPESNGYGFLGTSSYGWYYVYSVNFANPSKRELKRNITPLENNLGQYVLEDIEQMKPSFYKYKTETDVFDADNPGKYRSNMHLGLILDEAPDYLQDNTFSGIDIYALATLGVAGVKAVNEKVEKLEETIRDFGIVKMKEKTIYVQLDNAFSDKLTDQDLPVVTANTSNPKITVSIISQDKNGFTLALNKLPETEVMINWIAMAKVTVYNEVDYSESIESELREQLIVPETTKNRIKTRVSKQKQEPLELIDPEIKGRPKRIN